MDERDVISSSPSSISKRGSKNHRSLLSKNKEEEMDSDHPEYEVYLMNNNYHAEIHQNSTTLVQSVLNTGDDIDNEASILDKLYRKYPRSIAFDTVRYRNSKTSDISLGERLLEFELEQMLKRKEDLIHERQSLLVNLDEQDSHKKTIISSHQRLRTTSSPLEMRGYSTGSGDDGDIPECILYRKIREDTIDAHSSIPEISLPASEAVLQEQEIKLAGDFRNTKEYVVRLLTQFYKDQVDSSKLQKYKALHRWSRFAGTLGQLDRTESILLTHLSHYDKLYETSKVRHFELSSHMHHTPPQISENDFKIFVRHITYQITLKKHVDHFASKIKWISYTERFNLFRKAFETDRASKQETSLPRLAVSASEIHAQFEDIKNCFDLDRAIGYDQEYGQEFLYRVSKNFNVVFTSQTKALRFLPYSFSKGTHSGSTRATQAKDELKDNPVDQKSMRANEAKSASKNKKSERKNESQSRRSVYLKSLPFHPMEHFPSVQPSLEQRRQSSVLKETVTIDTILRNETAFLGTFDVSYAGKRLKQQAETHFQRAFIKKIVDAQDNDKTYTPTVEGGKKTINQLQAIYMLRYNRIREFKKKIMDILNYFRSLQRRLTLDKYGYGVSSQNLRNRPLVFDAEEEERTDFRRRIFTEIHDLEPVDSEAFMNSTNATDMTNLTAKRKHPFVDNRDDTYHLINKRDLAVRDTNGMQIMYTEAIKDLEDLEQELLSIGSIFIDRHQYNRHAQRLHSRTPDAHWGSDITEERYETEIDRFMVLEDLYESEAWYQDAKRKVVDCFMEAYEHCNNPKSQEELATIIIGLMIRRPTLDLTSDYFTKNYASEIMALELQYSLLRDIISHQIEREREYSRLVFESQQTDETDHDQSAIDQTRLGHPIHVIEESSLRTALFPGSTRTGFLDFYSSLSNIVIVHHLLENAYRDIKESFEINNPSVTVALKRTILQQALVEWKLLSEEDMIQKTIRLNMTEDRRVFEERIIMEDAEELWHIALSAMEQRDDEDKSKGTKSLVNSSGKLSGTVPRDLTSTQVLCNAIEMILLWKNLVDQLYETDVLCNLHLKQAASVAAGHTSNTSKPTTAQMERFLPLMQPIAYSQENAAKRNPLYNLVGGDVIEVLSFKTHMVGNLAIVEFSPELVDLNFGSKNTLRRIMQGIVLDDLRQAFQYQITQRILVQNCVRINQILLDNLFLSNRAKKNVQNIFDLTAIPTDETNSIFGEPLYRTTSLDRHRLERLFFNPNSFKGEFRKRAAENYARISDHIIKNRDGLMVKTELREVKRKLAQEYCISMISSIVPLAAKYQMITICSRIRSVASNITATAEQRDLVPDIGLVIGDEHDEIQITAHYSGEVEDVNTDSTSNEPRAMMDTKYSTSRNGSCVMAKDGLLVNPLYVPHFLQILRLEFNGSDSDGSHTRSRFRGSQLMQFQLEILQANYVILLFLWSRFQMSIPSSQTVLNPSLGLKDVPQNFRKIGSEIAHLANPEDPCSVRDYLVKKANIMFMKTSVTLCKLSDLLQVNKDITGARRIKITYAQLVVNRGCSSKHSNQYYNATNSMDNLAECNLGHRSYAQPFSPHFQHYFWPMISCMFIAKSQTEYRELTENQIIVSELNMFPFADILSAFLLELNEPQRNFYQGIDMNIEEQLDDILMEAKKYSTMQSDASTQLQYETMSVLLAQTMLKKRFMQSLSRNFSKDVINDAKRMEDIFTNTIISKSRRLYDKEIVEHNNRIEAERHKMSAVDEEKGGQGYGTSFDLQTADDTRKKLLREQRKRELLVLRQEYNKLLILDMVSAVKQEIVRMRTELRRMSQSSSTRCENPLNEAPPIDVNQGAYSNNEGALSANDGKLKIFQEFLSVLMKRGAKNKTKNGISAITIHEQDLQNALDIVGTHLKEWKEKRLDDLYKSASIIVDHHKQIIFNLEQKVKFLESMREMDRKSFSRRVSSETADKSYDLVFQVDTLTRENNKLLDQLRCVKEEAKDELRVEYEDVVRNLMRELLAVQNKFNDYKRSFYHNLDKEFSQVKEDTIVKLAAARDSSVALKSQMLQVVMEDNELGKLRRINENQEAGAYKLGVFHQLRQLTLQERYEKRVREAETEKEMATEEFFGDKQQLEMRQNLLRQSLIKTQSTLSNAEKEIEEIRSELKMEIKNKERLRIWKNKHAELFDQLQKRIEQYERWSKYDVDKLVLELEKRREQVKQLEQIEKRMNRKTELLERQSQKQLEEMRRRLQRETSLKTKAFQRLESLEPKTSSRSNTHNSGSAYSVGDGLSSARIEPLGTSAMWQKKYYDASADLDIAMRDLEIMKDALLQQGIDPTEVLGRHDASASSASGLSLRQSVSTLGRSRNNMNTASSTLDQTTISEMSGGDTSISSVSTSVLRIMPSYSSPGIRRNKRSKSANLSALRSQSTATRGVQ